MPFVNVPANTWTTVRVTVGETVVENRGYRPVYVSSQASNSSVDDGLELLPGQNYVFGSGKTVRANTFEAGGRVLWDELT